MEACPSCDLTYTDHRSGATFKDGYEWTAWSGERHRPSVRRVVGMLAHHKRSTWADHLEGCGQVVDEPDEDGHDWTEDWEGPVSAPKVWELPIQPPLAPMLAKRVDELPQGHGGGWLFEPKWNGFRVLVFRDGERLYLQSRAQKPLLRYFPELEEPLLEHLPERCVLDGELVVMDDGLLDFAAMRLRVHPAQSRIERLAAETPATFVAFDLLALGDDDLRDRPQIDRRLLLEGALAGARPPVCLTPMTRDRAEAVQWVERFARRGFDGVIAKHETLTYQPNARGMLKLKVEPCPPDPQPDFFAERGVSLLDLPDSNW